jgi:hypothetical protein
MKTAWLLAAGLAVTGCDMMPNFSGGPAPVDPARQAQFIAVVEASGCRLDQLDNEAVLVPAGFSDQEASAIGVALLSQGTAELADDGDLILLTENCI